MNRVGARMAGVLASAVAAMCCIGVPIMLSALASLGLTFLRDDRLLLPVMIVGLGVSLRSLWQERQSQRGSLPIALGLAGAGGILTGVFVWHGPVRTSLVSLGGLATLGAVWWSARSVQACATERSTRRP